MSQKLKPLTLSAQSVDSAHEKVISTRRNLKAKRTIFMQAQEANQLAESEFKQAKELHDQKLIETI